MKRGAIDMAMEYHRPQDDQFRVQPLMEETLVSMVRQGHPLVGDSLSLEQYVTLEHVVIDSRSPRGPLVDRELKRRGLSRNIALQVPHFLSMPLIVRTTDIICTLPLRMARVYAEHFRLKVLKPPDRLSRHPPSIWSGARAWTQIPGTSGSGTPSTTCVSGCESGSSAIWSRYS